MSKIYISPEEFGALMEKTPPQHRYIDWRTGGLIFLENLEINIYIPDPSQGQVNPDNDSEAYAHEK